MTNKYWFVFYYLLLLSSIEHIILNSDLKTCLCGFPGEREPGEGERRSEEGGEAAHGGGQLPLVRAEQP